MKPHYDFWSDQLARVPLQKRIGTIAPGPNGLLSPGSRTDFGTGCREWDFTGKMPCQAMLLAKVS
jgi:hypothetical protein